MAVGSQQVFPPIVVKVEKTCPSAQKWNCDFAVPSLKRYISEVAVAVIVVARVRVI